jgi:DNA-nicking Smr family endonuclease
MKQKASTRIRAAVPMVSTPAPTPPRAVPEELEPRRQRRLSRERDPIEASIDLHGFSRFEAEDQLRAFLMASQARGLRAVLVVTGQGRRGGGIIRASIHEWLQGHALRGIVSGFAMAHRRHGGDGAIYVTLKRRQKE